MDGVQISETLPLCDPTGSIRASESKYDAVCTAVMRAQLESGVLTFLLCGSESQRRWASGVELIPELVVTGRQQVDVDGIAVSFTQYRYRGQLRVAVESPHPSLTYRLGAFRVLLSALRVALSLAMGHADVLPVAGGWESDGFMASFESVELHQTDASYVQLNVQAVKGDGTEADRRFVLADGVVTHNCLKSEDLVFVLAASNLPWDLDIALLRRLEKRILVPLPNERARLTMIKGHLPEGEGGRAVGLDYPALARKTEGYSGSDIALLCKEAAMRPVRRLMKLLLSVPEDVRGDEIDSEVRLDPVVEGDMRAALACTRPSAQSKFLAKYAEWHREYGAGIHDVTMDAQSELVTDKQANTAAASATPAKGAPTPAKR